MSEELKKGIPKPIVIGRVEFIEDEKRRHDEECEKHLRKIGVLKEGQSLKDMNRPDFQSTLK